MTRLERVYKKLQDRLPNKYIVPIKVYKTSWGMIRAEADKFGYTYKSLYKWYQWFIDTQADYIDTDYYPTAPKKMTPKDWISISGNPIKILAEVNKYKEHQIAFILLHEIGHNVVAHQKEKEAGLFAKRWMKKLVKEGIIKYEKESKNNKKNK